MGTRGGASRQASTQRARMTIGPAVSSRSRCTRPAIVPPPLSSAVDELDVEAPRLVVADEAHRERLPLGLAQDGHAISSVQRASPCCGYSPARARTRHVRAHARPETLGGVSSGTTSANVPSLRGATLAAVNSSVASGDDSTRTRSTAQTGSPRRHAPADHVTRNGPVALEDELDGAAGTRAHCRSIAPHGKSAKDSSGAAL